MSQDIYPIETWSPWLSSRVYILRIELQSKTSYLWAEENLDY